MNEALLSASSAEVLAEHVEAYIGAHARFAEPAEAAAAPVRGRERLG